MLAKYEKRMFDSGAHVWLARYRNLHNLPHWHFEHELILLQEGIATVMIDDHVFHLQKGMCILCPGNSIHYINGSSDSILFVVQFDPMLTARATDPYRLQSPCFSDRYEALERLSDIQDEFKNRAPFFVERIDMLLSMLIIDIFRKEPLVPNTVTETNTLSQYKELLKIIDQNDHLLPFQDAAAFMHMSASHFSRYFQRLAGMSYSQYLNVLRVDKASRLLQHSPRLSMTEIMIQCDFGTIRNFNRVFKKLTGFAPRHLPSNYMFNIRSVPSEGTAFDPTLDTSILL